MSEDVPAAVHCPHSLGTHRMPVTARFTTKLLNSKNCTSLKKFSSHNLLLFQFLKSLLLSTIKFRRGRGGGRDYNKKVGSVHVPTPHDECNRCVVQIKTKIKSPNMKSELLGELMSIT